MEENKKRIILSSDPNLLQKKLLKQKIKKLWPKRKQRFISVDKTSSVDVDQMGNSVHTEQNAPQVII